MAAMNSVRVNKKGADRVRNGHLWIYRSDLVDVDVPGGSVVSVKDERGNFIGQALFSDASQIALRFLTLSTEESGTLPAEETFRKIRTPIVLSIPKETCCRR